MNLPRPFDYPSEAHIPKHAPSGYRNYQDYKPWLRDDFEFRCVYCLQRERWSREGHAIFSIDHVIPQSEAEAFICDYGNLVYACVRCNSARQDVPVLNPRMDGMGRHLRVEGGGTVRSLTEEGKFLIQLLHLNGESAVKERYRILRILERYQQNPANQTAKIDFLEAFGYPEDMPDLRSLRPPGGNSCQGSAQDCFRARKERGELSEIY
jgi:hypothetical protein